jgi:prepilin signal peptidase PulO-like enzyme (type II secretory pathway)
MPLQTITFLSLLWVSLIAYFDYCNKKRIPALVIEVGIVVSVCIALYQENFVGLIFGFLFYLIFKGFEKKIMNTAETIVLPALAIIDLPVMLICFLPTFIFVVLANKAIKQKKALPYFPFLFFAYFFVCLFQFFCL